MAMLTEVCGTGEPLCLKLGGGAVLRYHAEGDPRLYQTVAEHSWRVAVIMLHIWPDTNKDQIRAALYHDVAERITGDSPGPFKRRYPSIYLILKEIEDEVNDYLELDKPFTEAEKIKLKCANFLEQVDWCLRRGNMRIAENVARLVREHANKLGLEDWNRVVLALSTIAGGDDFGLHGSPAGDCR